jgi:hypothetical protein
MGVDRRQGECAEAWRERGASDSANEREHIPGSDGSDMLVNMEPELHASFDSPLPFTFPDLFTLES